MGEDVVWVDLVNVSVSGDTLRKTGGCDGCLDAGAASRQRLSLDSSYLEFPVLETELVRYIGLNTFSTTPLPTDILFGIKLVSGTAEVKEAGLYRADIPVAIGDVMRIEVKSGVVSYARNGTVFYTSSQSVSDPSLQADSAFINMDAAITGARVSGVISGGSTPASAKKKPPAPALSLTSVQTKFFRFGWVDVTGETEYRLLEDADASSGYARVATLAANTTSHDLKVFLPARINARYILQACNSAGCADSAPVMVNGAIAGAVGYVKASNTGAGDAFGYAVAFSGDGNTLAVGAPFEDSAAGGVNGDQNDNSALDIDAVYVFTRNGAGNWAQQAYLKAANLPRRRGSSFGMQSLALSYDGNTLALGAPRDPSSVIPGPSNNFTYNDTGSVYIFTRDAGGWSQQAYIKDPDVHREDSDASDGFGAAVALSADGNTLAIGSPGQNAGGGYDAGGVYVYVRDDGCWTQQDHVTSVNGFVWSAFGESLALSADGNILAVGASKERRGGAGINGVPDNQSIALASGAAYVFIRGAGVWSEQAYIKASDTQAWALFGASVALSNDGHTLAVGAPGNDSDNPEHQTDGGAAYVFSRSGGNWLEQGRIRASLPARRDYFGKSVSLSADGATLAVGMPGTVEHSGAVYLFKQNAGAWERRARLESPNAEAGDAFGGSVALFGNDDTLAVGAGLEDSAATGINGDQDDNTAPDSGAVYLY